MIIDMKSLEETIMRLSEIDRLRIRNNKSQRISEYPFVDSCVYNVATDEMEISFNQELETDGIDLEGLFSSGGVLKKVSKKEDETKEDDFLQIEPIGE